MRPWVIDASATVDAPELKVDSEDPHQLLYENDIIKNYLADDNVKDLIVVATKGFGKTFLLQAKRLRLEALRQSKHRSGIDIIPSNALIDRPIGAPPILSSRAIASMLKTPDYWQNVWLITIICTVLKRHRINPQVKSDFLKNLFENHRYSAFDIFSQIIQLQPKDMHACYNDLQSELIPSFRSLHSPTYLFLDNIDEYFQTFIAPKAEVTFIGERDPKIWSLAQLGLAIAARDLSQNPHVKICASLRKEAFANEAYFSDTARQVKSRLVELKYTRRDLLEIMRLNIAAEPNERLVAPTADDEFERFVGKVNLTLYHPHTKEEETLQDYVLRHTLGRPRDVCSIGASISAIEPSRRSAETIASAVNQAATEIFGEYIKEVRPHVKRLDFDILFKMIPSNIMSRDEIARISETYDEEWSARGNDAPRGGCHVFCDLYRLGLLGVVIEDRRAGSLRQKFAMPGETDLTRVGILPESSSYVVHSILDATLANYNSSYWQSFNKFNIVGHDRFWRSMDEHYFVVRGDVVDSHVIADDTLRIDEFKRFFAGQVDRAAKNLEHYEVNQGDSALLISRNVRAIWDAVRFLALALRGSEWRMSMRFGGDSGLILFRRHDGKRIPSGKSLFISSRLEALSKPGEILVTEDFSSRAASMELDLDIFNRRITKRTRPDISFINEKANIAKNGDSPMLTRLFSAKVPV